MPRHNGGITAALVPLAFAACIATGCETGETPDTEGPQPRQTVRPAAAPAMATRAYGPPQPTDFEKDDAETPDNDPTPKTTDEVSFADGESAFQAKDYAEATQLFTYYTEQHPDNPWGHFMRGLSSWKDGNPSPAEEAFGFALAIDPHHLKSLVNLSRVLIEQARTDDAFDTLTLARDIDPTSSSVHRLLGRTYAIQGKVGDAEDAYRHAIVLDDHDVWSMNNLGLLLLEQGRASEAVLPLARAVELRNDAPSFHNNLGMALEHTGRFLAAAAAYDSALMFDPSHDKASNNLARVERFEKDSEEPFDLEATARRFVDVMKSWPDTAYVAQ